jgi:hypothetical protein
MYSDDEQTSMKFEDDREESISEGAKTPETKDKNSRPFQSDDTYGKDSHVPLHIERIVIFYSDRSFSEYSEKNKK